MNKEKYLETRNALMGEVQALIGEGKTAEANAKMDEVKALDEKWAEICEAQANLNALANAQPCLNPQSLTDGRATAGANAGATFATASFGNFAALGNAPAVSAEEAYKTATYADAWAKVMTGKQLSATEYEAFHLVNEAYTHTTENTPVVIPESVANGIWKEIGERYPYWEDVKKTYVKGKLTVIKATGTTDSAWYVEGTSTADGTETFEKAELNGCELSRAITISWKLKEMAVADFLAYIQTAMAERMGAGLAYGVTSGAGIVSGMPSEPTGVITALKAEANTPQVKTYTEGELTYKDLTGARGLVKSGYTPAIYANSNTIWNVLANVVDLNGRPIFISDPANGGVYRVLGCVVKEDGSLSDGDILFSDPARGYQANINKQITVQTEDHVKSRETDYCGYAIVDGAPITTKAHALLTPAA